MPLPSPACALHQGSGVRTPNFPASYNESRLGSLLDTLAQRDIAPVIPPKANRKAPRACDFALYCERNLIERFFNKLKHFRAIATRYDKLARNFLAGAQLASAIILLN